MPTGGPFTGGNSSRSWMQRLIDTNPISTTWRSWNDAARSLGDYLGSSMESLGNYKSRVKPADASDWWPSMNGMNIPAPGASASGRYGAASGLAARPAGLSTKPTGTFAPMPTAWSGSAKGITDMLLGQAGLPEKAVSDLASSYGVGRINLPKPSGSTAAQGSAGGATFNDPLSQWYDAFTNEHGGVDPVDFYGGGVWRSEEDALKQALWDKEWGDQFARTYGRAPTEDEWKSSYGHRNAMYYGGASASGG